MHLAVRTIDGLQIRVKKLIVIKNRRGDTCENKKSAPVNYISFEIRLL